LKTHQVDGFLANTATGYAFDELKIGHLLLPASAYVDEIELFTTIASTAILEKSPDAVRRFLKAWYDTVAYMKNHKAETVATMHTITGFSEVVEEREYDALMPAFSSDGRFKPKALETIRTIFADLKVLDGPVDLSQLTTEQYLPKK
ncbi:MAG TPA: hypothetical protein VN808_10170, partial [Stellaceae bacterium]|nr:hypothetical protein [Stellaceae bacterium]